MAVWDPSKAPTYINNATTFEGTFGVPLNQLMASKWLFEEKTDDKREKLQKASFSISSFRLMANDVIER